MGRIQPWWETSPTNVLSLLKYLPPVAPTWYSFTDRINRSTAGCPWWPPPRNGQCWEQIHSSHPPSHPGSWCLHSALTQRWSWSNPWMPEGKKKMISKMYKVFFIRLLWGKGTFYPLHAIKQLCRLCGKPEYQASLRSGLFYYIEVQCNDAFLRSQISAPLPSEFTGCLDKRHNYKDAQWERC